MNKSLKEILEGFIVAAVMMFIFLPVRLIFYNFVSDNWYGSFGVVSAVVILLVVLSYYDKLGYFGRIYWRSITRVHKGKARIFSYSLVVFMIYFWGAASLGMNYADNNQEEIQVIIGNNKMTPEDEKSMQILEEGIQNKDVKTVSAEIQKQYDKYDPLLFAVSIPVLFLLPVFNFITWSVLVDVMNDFTNGWFLHFSTVFFIEGLEVVGIFIYTYIITKSKNKRTTEV